MLLYIYERATKKRVAVVPCVAVERNGTLIEWLVDGQGWFGASANEYAVVVYSI